VTAKPEITHYELDDNDRFLILACDGLWDDMSSEKSVEIISKLVGENYTNNYATALIQAALSGAEHGGPLVDNEKIQHHLSIQPPLCRRYRDDMTVNVIFFKEFSGVEAKGKILDKPAEYIPATLSQLDKWVTYLNGRFIAKL
jgi:serine/threonine protein phosphatase PrpC